MAKFSCFIVAVVFLAVSANTEGKNEIQNEERIAAYDPEHHVGFASQRHHHHRPGGRPRPPINGCRNKNRERNRKTVVDFYQKVFGQKQFDLIDKYVAEDYIQHNPHVADGREALKEALAGPIGQGPPITLDIQRAAADGDLVWVHLRSPAPAENTTYTVMDIFRVNCQGMIQEHWDVEQDTNVPSKNPHPFF